MTFNLNDSHPLPIPSPLSNARLQQSLRWCVVCALPRAWLVLKPCEGMVPHSRLLFSLSCRPLSRHQFPDNQTTQQQTTVPFLSLVAHCRRHYCSVPVHFVATRLSLSLAFTTSLSQPYVCCCPFPFFFLIEWK